MDIPEGTTIQIVHNTKAERKLAESWGEDNIPYNISLTIEELPIAELAIKRCRSFRSDLHHKLNILVACYGSQKKAAKAIKIPRQTFVNWANWKTAPGSRYILEKIDAEYELALERLVLERKRKQQNNSSKPPRHD